MNSNTLVSGTISKIFLGRFLKFILVWHHVTFKDRVVRLWQMNFDNLLNCIAGFVVVILSHI